MQLFISYVKPPWKMWYNEVNYGKWSSLNENIPISGYAKLFPPCY